VGRKPWKASGLAKTLNAVVPIACARIPLIESPAMLHQGNFITSVRQDSFPNSTAALPIYGEGSDSITMVTKVGRFLSEKKKASLL
jgi:hypothetical protein